MYTRALTMKVGQDRINNQVKKFDQNGRTFWPWEHISGSIDWKQIYPQLASSLRWIINLFNRSKKENVRDFWFDMY